jgi:hypothetical protein
MKHFLAAFALVALVGCGASTGTGPETTTTTSDSDAPGSTAIGGPDSTTSTAPAETATTSGREKAPDFTLELGKGGTFTLSEGAKPVYLVFWAEW